MSVTESMGHVRMAVIQATLVQSVIRVSCLDIGLNPTHVS